jgi:type IV pilus assembly protein PilB
MPITNEIQNLTLRQAPPTEIRRVAVEQGMYDLRADGLAKAASGQTSVKEVVRVAV